MNLKLTPSEQQIIKDALANYRNELVGQGDTYTVITGLINNIEDKQIAAANRVVKIIPNKQWMFNFVTGGWNTVFAKTKRGAIAQAYKEYKTSSLIPNPKTFIVATDAAMKTALSSFY